MQPRRREGRLTVAAPGPEGVRPAAGVRRRRAAAHGGSDGPVLRGGARVAWEDAGRMRAEGGVRGEGELAAFTSQMEIAWMYVSFLHMPLTAMRFS